MKKHNFIQVIIGLTLVVFPSLFLTSCKVDQEALQKALEVHTIEGAKYVGMETCGACHEGEVKNFELSSHARISIPTKDGSTVEGCEICHGPGSLHADMDDKDREMKKDKLIINPRKNPDVCFACHMDKKMEFTLPYHHPVNEGKVSCADCHSPHGAEVRPWSSTSIEDVNEVCFKCHKDQRGPFVFEHEGVREGCTSCHQVHGSINDKMLIARDSNLCLRCHTQADYPNVGLRSHSGSFLSGTCFSAKCHTAVHGSNFDDHLRY